MRKMAGDVADDRIAAAKQLATVDSPRPLTIRIDGATKAVPAHHIDSYTPVKGDRVFVEVYSRQFWVLGTFDNVPASVSPTGKTTWQFTRSYPVLGPLIAYTFPGFAQAVPKGMSIDLIAVEAVLSTGTVDVVITQAPFQGAPVAIVGLDGPIAVTDVDSGYLLPTSTTPVTDKDRFSFVTTSPSGTGDIMVDYTFQATLL
jgi:signal peptidase I